MGNFKALTLLLLLGTFILSSCGGSDDDGDDPNIGVSLMGVHRIEVSMDGDYSKFYPSVAFSASRRGDISSCKIFDADKNPHNNFYQVEYRGGSVFAYSEPECFRMAASVVFLNTDNKAGSVSITCKGYRNDKLEKKETKTVSFAEGESGKTAYFDSMEGFTK